MFIDQDTTGQQVGSIDIISPKSWSATLVALIIGIGISSG